ncbi:BRO-N domain-containing protein [Streptomyces mirabilis]|uniref:BRO-N domain-containing protein n=1 Tax=Streptomyces mirabilis TaxID=68239 RepID=UPI0033CF0D2D
MTTPIVFDIEGSGIRFSATDDGIPYAIAADYAKVLGYTRTSDALKLLDEDEKGTAICRTPGGPQEMKVIYEDGLWELIFRSSLPGAKAIKARVKAILKQIRETGSYEAEPMRLGPTTVVWEQAAAIARLQYGLNVNTDELRELLTKGGILTTTGRPHKKWEHLFWPLPTRWEIHASVLPQLIVFARKIRRELAVAEQDLQMSLPLPVAGLVRDLPELGGAA